MLSRDEIVKHFKYNKGKLFNRKTGSCGWVTVYGYRTTDYKKKKYKTHHLIWLYFYNYLPKELDHINGDRLDNRISNLREVNRIENCRNKKLSITNKTGTVGVCFAKRENKYRAYIVINYKQKSLGYFDTLEEAKTAREAANIKYGFHKNHGKR